MTNTSYNIAMFVPCYMDLLYPESALKTFKLLEHMNLKVSFLFDQVCCGQPFFNSGEHQKGLEFALHFKNQMEHYDFIIVLAGSCTSMIRNHYKHFIDDIDYINKIQNKVFEFTEFLHDKIKIQQTNLNFLKNETIGILYSCHGLRELGLAKGEELNYYNVANKVKNILNLVKSIKIVEVDMWDECCGFGGAFSYYENDLSVKTGKDYLKKFIDKNINTIIGYDYSCLGHLQSIANYQKWPIKFYYIGEFLYDSMVFVNE